MPKKLLSDRVVAQIRKMIANVQAHPEELDQNSWPENTGEALPQTEGSVAGTTCGSSFCAAGHIVFARSPKLFKKLALNPEKVDWKNVALGELGKSFNTYLNKSRKEYEAGDLAWSLFGSVSDWPRKFAKMYQGAWKFKTEKKREQVRAKAFAARWEAFIASDGHDVEPDYYDKKK